LGKGDGESSKKLDGRNIEELLGIENGWRRSYEEREKKNEREKGPVFILCGFC